MKNYCRDCLGRCPENCDSCLYKYCKKPVDFALVHFNWLRSVLHEFTYSCEDFAKWFRCYFGL